FAKGTGIGRCGVTAFSYGGVNLESLFASCKAKGSFGGSFYDNFWRELIMFDPVPSSPDSFVGNVKSWYASGAKGRNFRIYTQPNNAISWYQSNAYTPLAQALAGGSETKGADGAFETDLAASGGTGGATALFTPPAFWNGTIAPQPTYDNLHPTFPFAFMQHALDNSNFT
ncbi:MAG TPA: hypothetical protein VFF73_24470, partial [Planctomycetota bacterium]|nr:hypothetical protein [Planctomycetota bacterium]